MEITTIVGCKISCEYCPQKKFVESYKRRSNTFTMTLKTFKNCIDKIPATEEIRFSGMSEPWLNKECTKMLLYAHKRKHKISIFTTLVGMNVSDIEAIESIPIRFINVHLPNQELTEKISINEHYLKVLNKLCKSKIKFSLHTRLKSGIPKKLKTVLGDINVGLRPLSNRAGNLNLKNILPIKRKQGRIYCPWKPDLRTSNYTVLLPNGEVLFCCQDFGMRHILGNLLLHSYNSLFGKELALIKRNMQQDGTQDILCRYCDVAVEMKK